MRFSNRINSPCQACKRAPADEPMEKFPAKVFELALDKQLRRMIRPPTKKHLGKELRKCVLVGVGVIGIRAAQAAPPSGTLRGYNPC